MLMSVRLLSFSMVGETAVAEDELVTTDDKPREFFLDLFIEVVNYCRPHHPYYSGGEDDTVGPYPLTASDIEFSYRRSDSNTWASCGPRRGENKVFYAIDHAYFQSLSFERVLAITVHELTHITVGTHNSYGKTPMHPPEFWNTMAFNGMTLLDHFADLDYAASLDDEEFREELITDANSHMVDQRSETVTEVQGRLREWLGAYPKNKLASAD